MTCALIISSEQQDPNLIDIIKCAKQCKIIIIWVNCKFSDCDIFSHEYEIEINSTDMFDNLDFRKILKKNDITKLYFCGLDDKTTQNTIEIATKKLFVIGDLSNFIIDVTFFGEGNSKIIYDVLPEDSPLLDFDKIKNEVVWNEMYQRESPVPRLIAIQSTIESDGSIPLYRHPFDEQPDVTVFTPTVKLLCDHLSELLKQEFNHVLIQYYRDGTDNIGEHSDKTLDIQKDSFIVNFSIGATRKMTLQHKNKELSIGKEHIILRHNSLFMLDLETNKKWLHGIKPDKRPNTVKDPDETLFLGQRISFTFRTIKTYITQDNTLIGQGARKDGFIGDDSLELVTAFSKENHEWDFDWDKNYANGFNCHNFRILNENDKLQKTQIQN